MPGPTARVAALIGGGGDLIRIPAPDEYGEADALAARVCRPQGDAPAPVVVLAHGLPPAGDHLSDMSPASCANAGVRWFRDKGYAVVIALRRGYGGSQGDWAENPGACASPNYPAVGLQGAHDLDAILTFALRQPWAKPDDALIVGEDVGGWAVMAYASVPHTVPARLVDIAGITGARSAGQAGHVCRPDLLLDAAAGFGATARAPMLWIYPKNDRIIPTPVAVALHDAFVRAGGRAELVQPEASAANGHDLLFDEAGPGLWGSLLAFFLSGS